jgi:CubicO group peptidase (beta-lactamase class C family)
MKIIVATPLGFDEPGSKFQYNNSGFIVLGKIIEKLERKSYFDVLQERILRPLKMDHSTFTVDFNDPKNFAKGYTKDLNGTSAPQTSIIPPASDGGLFTTADDLLKFDRAVFEHKIISERMLKEMETPRMSSYGYATIVTKIANGIGYGHNGGMPGYEADYRHFFIGNDQYTVIILSNHDRKAIRTLMDLQMVLATIH